jgi:hypothetical protein
VTAVLATAACETSKSSNPLSASVAGPIPGINITAPVVMTPTSGTKIAVDKQPITLTVNNASTNGVRPLTYLFEVATDANFATKVFALDGITPGDGQTSVKLPAALATGRTYYWHARAQDGANTGAFMSAISFDVFTPIVIQAPGLVSPAANTTADSIRPNFVINNAPHSGPVGAITYLIEVADSGSFANRIAAWTVAEQANTTQTTLTLNTDLNYSTVYYWHVRAADPTTTGPFSATFAFVTPDKPVAPPPTGGGGGGGGGGACAGSDQMNLGSANVYNSPPDVAGWAVTGCITRLNMSSSAGLSFDFTTSNSWPDVIPPGFEGPLEYTVWAVVNQGGTWNTSGFIQMWRGRASTGAPILSDFAQNWAYDSRWGPMAGYQPHAGEQMGFFLSAGNARGQTTVSSVRERTNVVVVALPPGDNGSFAFSLARTLKLIR